MLKSILLSWVFPAIVGLIIFSSADKFDKSMSDFLICIFVIVIIRDVFFYVLGRRREKRLSAKEDDCAKKENDLERKHHLIDTYIESEAASKFQFIFNRLTLDSLFPKPDLFMFLEAFKNALPGTRQYKSLTENFVISDPSCTVKIKSKDNEYLTSLKSCTCIDFQRTKKPCKHMYFLALHLGALSCLDVNQLRAELSKLQHEIAGRKKEIDHHNLFAKFLKDLNSNNGYSSVSSLFSELERYRCNAYHKVMLTKRSPAVKSAEKVVELSKEKTELVKEAKEYKFKYNTLLTILPEVELLLAHNPVTLLDTSTKSDLLRQINSLIRDMEKSSK